MCTASAWDELNVIVVDDDEDHIRLVTSAITRAFAPDRAPPVVTAYTDPDRALAELPAHEKTVVLIDYQLHGSTALDWIEDFVRADAGPVIVVTSSGDEHIAAEAFRRGASDYIVKNTMIEEAGHVRASIKESLRRHGLEQTNRELSRRLKRANRQLEIKNARFAELTETAHRFVDDVAHEFRTPLAVIMEFASIISDGLGGDINEKQRTFLKHIQDASRDLAHLVDDFLDSGKLRAQTLRVDRREHTVTDLIESAWAILGARADAKGVTLERDIAPSLPTVFADAEKMRRSLVNLVVNAIKFSNPGDTVTVSARSFDSHSIEIGVEDHGPGLPEEQVQQLFERFQQGDEASRISTKGFGLGLNIVKELVSINLGQVMVSSKLGEGSRFSFTLPRYRVDDIVAATLSRAGERDPRAVLTLLSAKRPGSPDGELMSFASSVSHATDVVLPATEPGCVLIVGDTADPERWQDRVLHQDEEHRERSQDYIHPLRIEQKGSWPLHEAREAILDALTPEPEEERRVA